MTGPVTVSCGHRDGRRGPTWGPAAHFPEDCRLALIPFPEFRERVVLIAPCPAGAGEDRTVVQHGPMLGVLLASGVVVDDAVRVYLHRRVAR